MEEQKPFKFKPFPESAGPLNKYYYVLTSFVFDINSNLLSEVARKETVDYKKPEDPAKLEDWDALECFVNDVDESAKNFMPVRHALVDQFKYFREGYTEDEKKALERYLLFLEYWMVVGEKLRKICLKLVSVGIFAPTVSMVNLLKEYMEISKVHARAAKRAIKYKRD